MVPKAKGPYKSMDEQIQAVAFTLKHSPSTIRHWIAAGCVLDDPDSLIDFYIANATRRRNRGPRPLEFD